MSKSLALPNKDTLCICGHRFDEHDTNGPPRPGVVRRCDKSKCPDFYATVPWPTHTGLWWTQFEVVYYDAGKGYLWVYGRQEPYESECDWLGDGDPNVPEGMKRMFVPFNYKNPFDRFWGHKEED